MRTVYRALVEGRSDAAGALVRFGVRTGLAPVEAAFARQLDELRRSCGAREGLASGPCLEGSERLDRELKLLRDLVRRRDLQPSDRVYLGALIYHHHAVVSYLEPESERTKLRCRKSRRDDAECGARKRDLLELGSATAQLADLAAYQREKGPDSPEAGELRRVLRARFEALR